MPGRIVLLSAALALSGVVSVAWSADGQEHPLEWLIGEWQAEFRPHGDDTPAPTMSFEWREPGRKILTLTGTRPGPGGTLVPEYETTVVWHPVRERYVFLGAYLSGDRRVTEDGEIEILDDGSVRLYMDVHYPSGETVPFTNGLVAGPEGHTLRFHRTFRRAAPDELRGFFRILRGDVWEDPHPEMSLESGYPWRRLPDASPTPPPKRVLEHWWGLVGTWITDNSAYQSDTELADSYGLDWSWGIGETSLVGRLYGLRDGEEIGTYWQFREYWHPIERRLITEQFGAAGALGRGPQSFAADGSMEMEQTFYYPASGATARVGHRASIEGDVHTTASFDIDESGEWRPRRAYVWHRQPAD